MASSLAPLRLLRRIPAASLLARRTFSSTPRAANLDADADPATTYRAFQRKNEDDKTLRARLIYQSRYRGTLESDLLLSTFAAEHLPKMTRPELEAYDQFLLEEDWDIYYWATQDLEPASSSSSSGRAPTEDVYKRTPPPGEWARMAGNFQAAYRPVPDRWRDSELLAKLRQHVVDKSATTGEKRGGGMSARPLLFGEGNEKD